MITGFPKAEVERPGFGYVAHLFLIPVKPIGEHETEITEIYQTKLMGLFDKIKP